MKKNKIILLSIIVVTFFLQVYVFYDYPLTYYQNGFAIGLNKDSAGGDIIYVLIPAFFILFFTSGSVYEMTHGYGKLFVIRNYSKTKLMLRKILKITIAVLLIVCVQYLVFCCFNHLLTPVSGGVTESLLMYFVILLALVLLQHLLEFYLPIQIVNLSLFIYSYFSYYVIRNDAFSSSNPISESIWVKLLLWPSLLFGVNNGAVDGDPVYGVFLTAGICLNLLLVVLCIRKFKKTDIF